MVYTTQIVNNKKAGECENRYRQLYENAFHLFAPFVARRGGSLDDAKDAFHDALVIFYEKTMDPNFSTQISDERYVTGIAKHLWFRKFRANSKMTGLDDIEKSISIPPDYFDESARGLTNLLELTGRKCLRLLRAFYYDNLPLLAIRETFGFANVHSAAVQKYKCIEKMRDAIQKKCLNYEDFAGDATN